MEPIPNLSRAFSMIIQEERQRSLGSRDNPQFAASVKPPSTNPPRNKKPRPSYSNYSKPGHLVDKCFFIHSFPPSYGDKKKQDKGKAKAHQASSSSPVDTPANTTDLSVQCQQLISLLSQQLSNTTARVDSDQTLAAASNLAGNNPFFTDFT
uniref:Uncharacterized protein n=1 Tax=Cannabis sativa TaxID=3483 RepID=A0A803Q6X0_CANSA